MTRSITATKLKQSLDAGSNHVLLDVQPAEYHAAGHLPQARNACVYEVTFLEQVTKLVPDKATPIVVYGSSRRSLASSAAARKLRGAGYRPVLDFHGGLAEWKAASFAIVRSAELPRQRLLGHGIYQLDPARSLIEWTGRNLAHTHRGTLRVASGNLRLQRGRVTGGQFVIDMTSIADADILDQSYAQLLVHHLSSDDFFDVANHPTARFVVTASRLVSRATPGTPNLFIRGKLTIKDVSHPIRFPAVLGVAANGDLVAQANFDLDRTRWNVLYGSGKFFENLGQHLVNDLISVQIELVATGRRA